MAGFLPEYVYGTMTLPVENGVQDRDLVSWLGIEPSTDAFETAVAAVNTLANGGIPMAGFDPNGINEITPSDSFNITLSRVWVRVDINGTTHNLDPAFKRLIKNTSSLDVLATSGVDKQDLLTSAGGTIATELAGRKALAACLYRY